MHPQQSRFVANVKALFPDLFHETRVLDVGSLDINGSNRPFFSNPKTYVGVDLGPGPNVDRIGPIHTLDFDESFDVVISTEMLEHDVYAKASLAAMYGALRDGGLLIVTCAGPGRGEHGTHGHTPADSPFTNDYYGNLTEDFLRENLCIPDAFEKHELVTSGTDIYFWGIV